MSWLDYINPVKKAKNLWGDIKSGNARSIATGVAGTLLGLPEMGRSEAFRAHANSYETPVQSYGTSGGLPATQNTSQSLTSSDTGGGGGGDGGTPTPAFEAYYNGQLYTDPEAYQNAVRADLVTNFNNQKAQLDRAYDSGLISFDQKQEQLGKLRTKSMSDIAGFFSAASPEAYQSTQGGLQDEAQQTYETNTTDLSRQKQGFVADTLGNIQSLQQDYQSKADMLAGQLTEYMKTNPELLASYTNKIGAPTSETPQNVLDQFGKFNLTQQLYGNQVPAIKKFPVSTPTKKTNVSPLAAALYPDQVNAYA